MMMAPGTAGVSRTAEQCNVLAFDAAVEMQPVDGPGTLLSPDPSGWSGGFRGGEPLPDPMGG